MRICLTIGRTVQLAALLTAVLAGGCGGDDGVTPPPSPPPAPTFTQIAPQNQDAVARLTAATFIRQGRDPVNGLAAGVGATALHILSNLQRPPEGSLSVISQTKACGSGTLTTTVDDRDNDQTVSSGDTMTLGFNLCRDSDNSVMDGTFVVGVEKITELSPTLQISGTFTFVQFLFVDDGYTLSIGGELNGIYTDTALYRLSRRFEATVAPGGLVAQQSAAFGETYTYDADFTIATEDSTPMLSGFPRGPSTLSTALAGTVHMATLGGRMKLVTPSELVQVSGSSYYPHTGQVLVSGDTSKLRLTVASIDRVLMELDANNDGNFEVMKEVTWLQLML